MSPSTRQFVRHYIEMVAAMFLGMAVLWVPAGLALEAAGSSWTAVNDDAPALMLLAMAAMMTAPMVGWMAYRGHSRRANLDMTAAMFVPAFAAMAFLPFVGSGLLVGLEHVGMLLAMLGAMLLRPAEYAHTAHGEHEMVTA